MTEFTKGLWEVVNATTEGNNCKRIFAGNTLIAIVTNSDMEMNQIVSNARLIAAAPDLYKALNAIAGDKSIQKINGELHENAVKALAKARGEL